MAQICPSNAPPSTKEAIHAHRLITLYAFLPPTKEAIHAFLMLLDSWNVGSKEDEEDSKASFKVTIDPQRELVRNFGFDTQNYFSGLEDL